MPAPHDVAIEAGPVWVQRRERIEKIVTRGRAYYRAEWQGVRRRTPRAIRDAGDTVRVSLTEEPLDDEGWKRRARRAEARREAARAIAMSESLKLDARVLELERELEQKTATVSWKLTAPLRALNRMRWERAERGEEGR